MFYGVGIGGALGRGLFIILLFLMIPLGNRGTWHRQLDQGTDGSGDE